MAPVTIVEASHLANPLASLTQLETTSSQLEGLPSDVEASVRYQTARLLQAAGILLRLPQEIIAQSIVILYRSLVGPDGINLLEHDAKDVAAASLYLSAKPSATPLSPRSLLTVFECLTSAGSDYASTALRSGTVGPEDGAWNLSEGTYESARHRMYALESHMLKVLGFSTHCALPYTLCINYLQTLDVFHSSQGSLVAKRAFAHLNTALLSPQLLHLTQQPPALATAAIYLAAREVGAPLPDVEWWEVFDVEREELGFLVVAMLSVEGFAAEEKQTWGERKVPLTAKGLREEVEGRDSLHP